MAFKRALGETGGWAGRAVVHGSWIRFLVASALVGRRHVYDNWIALGSRAGSGLRNVGS